MMRFGFLLVCALGLCAQDPNAGSSEILGLNERLRSAVDAGDWKKAAELSGELKSTVTSERDRALAADSIGEIDRIIGWLPGNTETIIVAQQAFTLTQPEPNAPPSALSAARSYVLGLLGSTNDEEPIKSLYGQTVRFAMIAARKFSNHPPDGSQAAPLGMIAYQGCAVYAFAGPVVDVALRGPAQTAVEGHKVWTKAGKQYDQARDAKPQSETYWMTPLQGDLLLVCNDKDFLSLMLEAKDRSLTGTILKRFPEWKQADRSAPLWGVRHFVPGAALTDPTYPSGDGPALVKDPSPIGMVLEVGLPAGRVRLRWLSVGKDNPFVDLSGFQELGRVDAPRNVAEGVWEISVSDQGPQGSFMIFGAMEMLGFAVLV